ncbi:MAG: alpha-galactosidase [Lachnospiraceae bacterium]|nr:alpha-galactosidase [Lachnospiraceae bacterium]
MAIIFQEKERIFTLQTLHTTYQMKADARGALLHLYYGKKAAGSLDYLLTFHDRAFSGNPADVGNDRTYSMDTLPLEYPTLGVGDYRNPALVLENGDGTVCADLRYCSHEIRNGKYALQGLPAVFAGEEEAQTLSILLKDSVSGVCVELLYGVLEREDIITRAAVITNAGKDTVIIQKAASACLDFLYGEYELISFYGRHAMERSVQRMPVGHGSFSVGSRRGTSSHQYNPGVILTGKHTTEEQGGCYGLLFAYSGNFSCEAEKDQFDQTRVLMGLGTDFLRYPLQPGECFTVPETIMCYSDQGLGELSRHYHDCIRHHICRGKYAKETRPLLLNSWEGAYFHFTGETIVNLAREAKPLGIDMVVMDDGWFGKRDNDFSGLGDWQANEEKLQMSLGELVKRVNDEGVRFGIWMEPEMVSEDSDLYRAHPDWALCFPGREAVRGRYQLVLDFSREDVREAVFTQVCEVLDSGNIEYLKWDFNRSIADIASAQRVPGKVTYDYILGLYDFLEKLSARYPELLIEGCSGGGGRFDAGMLYYTPQIWCSDNTDAADRAFIQYGTSFFYPACTMGAHVSAVPNHQTGRTTSLQTRGVTAMAGTYGFELNPALLTDAEKEEVKEQVQTFKRVEELVRNGDYYRLSDPYEEAFAAWAFVSKEKDRALLSVVMLEKHANMPVSYVRLRGLLPEEMYENTADGRVYTGSALMEAGIALPLKMGEYQSFMMEFCRGDK